MVEISTSLLSVEKEKIIKTIYNLETAKIDYFHIDVMDGEFVENSTCEKMLEYCDYLTSITNVPLDVHLMVNNVKKYVDLFLPYNPNIITFHYEALKDKNDLLELIKYIHSNNCKVGIAIKPNTDISNLYSVLDKINVVLIMTVEPGKGGQKLILDVVSKISKLAKYVEANKLDTIIEADGGINVENVNILKEAGVEIIVVGTGIINAKDYYEISVKLKE